MAESVIFLLLFTASLVFILQPASVRYSYVDEAKIEIDFLFFTLLLYPARNRRKKRSNMKLRAARYLSLRKALATSLPYCRATFERIDIFQKPKNPDKNYLNPQFISALLFYLTAYFDTQTKELTLSDFDFISYKEDDENKYLFDVTLNFRLICFYIFAFSYLHELSKKKRRWKIKNDRKQNG